MERQDEWGPWIEHDGEHVPDLGAALVDAWLWPVWLNRPARAFEGSPKRAQFRANEVHDDNWLIGPNDCSLVVCYRIRKPRGMVVLESLIADLPEQVDA